MKFRKHKGEQAQENEKCYGYNVTEPCGDFDTGRVGICFVKAILMFGAVLGTTLSIVSAFNLQVNLAVLVVAFLLLSMLLSFMHYNRKIFNIGYPLTFLVFAFSIFQNRSYVNSGYQAIVNQMKTDYLNYFKLNYSGEAYEALDNRYVTMTYAFLYIGFFLIVLLNIAISNYMSVLLTVLLTFPFLQFGLYIERMPSLISIFLLLFVYAGVLFLKRSGHYSLSERRKKDQAFVVRKNIFSYKGKGKAMGQLLGVTCVVTLVFSLAAYPIMHLTLPGSDKTSSLKASTDTVIKNLVQGGISSLFNRYDATGGISKGRLGGVNRVRADYETDLEVTFVPSSLEPIYLKAYTGQRYTGNQWEEPDYDEGVFRKKDLKEEFGNLTARLEANRLARFSGETGADVQSGKMAIKNVGADSDFIYLPYYSANETDVLTVVDHSILYVSAAQGSDYTSSYYPYTQDLSGLMKEDYMLDSDNTDIFEKAYIRNYDRICKSVYTEIPENIQLELNKVTKEIGEGGSIEETVERIQDYFEQNYTYSLNPGATPQGKDFVTWFLENQKKGFCAHFATAGTLLCRAYGIPARYVEGYVIQSSDIASAKPKEGENVSDWFSGTNELEKTGVVTVSVPDANAHAWTEIYIENFGWVPVDFTPPSDESNISEDYSSFLQLFSGLFSVSNDNSISADGNQGQQSGISNAMKAVLGENSFILLPLGILVLVLLVIALVRWLYRTVHPLVHRNLSYKKGNYDEVLLYDYQRLVRALRKYAGMQENENENENGDKSSASVLPEDAFARLSLLFSSDMIQDNWKETLTKTCSLLEKGLYGKDQLSKLDADYVISCIDRCVKKLRKIRTHDDRNGD